MIARKIAKTAWIQIASTTKVRELDTASSSTTDSSVGSRSHADDLELLAYSNQFQWAECSPAFSPTIAAIDLARVLDRELALIGAYCRTSVVQVYERDAHHGHNPSARTELSVEARYMYLLHDRAWIPDTQTICSLLRPMQRGRRICRSNNTAACSYIYVRTVQLDKPPVDQDRIPTLSGPILHTSKLLRGLPVFCLRRVGTKCTGYDAQSWVVPAFRLPVFHFRTRLEPLHLLSGYLTKPRESAHLDPSKSCLPGCKCQLSRPRVETRPFGNIQRVLVPSEERVHLLQA